jgi:transcriptional regulator with XRE-family HTH domain
MTIGDRIYELRKQKGWNADKLAYKAQLHPSAIRLYESGHRMPNVDNLRKISTALGVTLGAFHKCDSFIPKQPKHETLTSSFL